MERPLLVTSGSLRQSSAPRHRPEPALLATPVTQGGGRFPGFSAPRSSPSPTQGIIAEKNRRGD